MLLLVCLWFCFLELLFSATFWLFSLLSSMLRCSVLNTVKFLQVGMSILLCIKSAWMQAQIKHLLLSVKLQINHDHMEPIIPIKMYEEIKFPSRYVYYKIWFHGKCNDIRLNLTLFFWPALCWLLVHLLKAKLCNFLTSVFSVVIEYLFVGWLDGLL